MRTPAPEIREKLADRFKQSLAAHVALLESRGIPKKSLGETLTSIAVAGFLSGLDIGYDMAAQVYGADDE